MKVREHEKGKLMSAEEFRELEDLEMKFAKATKKKPISLADGARLTHLRIRNAGRSNNKHARIGLVQSRLFP